MAMDDVLAEKPKPIFEPLTRREMDDPICRGIADLITKAEIERNYHRQRRDNYRASKFDRAGDGIEALAATLRIRALTDCLAIARKHLKD